ncbi:hypothetical protein [Streptomyces triculaminicus]|uniref:hypothetical protein n=1 Tax=Streptomyces TaxID=1883 RepID=UPI0033F147EE
MGMGWCIGLIAAGGILTFAVDWQIDGMNITLVGLILMAAGLLGLSAYVSVFKRRRMQPPPPAARVIEEDHRITR